MVCGIRLISGCVGSAGRGLWIWGCPVAGIGCRIGGDTRERGATDVVAEGVLREGGKDGGELNLCGAVESGISELLVVKVPGRGVVGARPVVWLGRKGGGGELFLSEGRDAARVSVWGRGGHSSLGEVKVGLGTAMRQLPIRRGKKKRVGAVVE